MQRRSACEIGAPPETAEAEGHRFLAPTSLSTQVHIGPKADLKETTLRILEFPCMPASDDRLSSSLILASRSSKYKDTAQLGTKMLRIHRITESSCIADGLTKESAPRSPLPL